MPSEPGPAPPNSRTLKIAGITAVVVAVGVAATGMLTRARATIDARHWSNDRAVPLVHLIEVRSSAASSGLTLPGTMQAWNAAKLYARVNGYLKDWQKDIGDHVAAGTALGAIETPELDQQIIQARANLAKAQADAALAKSTADRWNDLLSTNSVSHQEADEKNGDLAAKSAAVQAAKADLGRLTALKQFAVLRAPFAGTVTLRSADIGDLVGPGASNQQPLFAVADVHKIRVYISVPQTYSAASRPGLSATLTAPEYPGRVFTAHLIGDAGAVDPRTGTFQMQMIADNPDGVLRPGGFVQVHFDAPGQKSTVVIPSSALVFRSQGAAVATVSADNRVQMHPITIGRDLGTSVEVVAGLQPHERIVDTPPDSIVQGETVRVGLGNDG